jgi:hypothetical protein
VPQKHAGALIFWGRNGGFKTRIPAKCGKISVFMPRVLMHRCTGQGIKERISSEADVEKKIPEVFITKQSRKKILKCNQKFFDRKYILKKSTAPANSQGFFHWTK